MFLAGAALTKKMRSVCRTHKDLKVAIAYWGQDALELLPLKSTKKNLRVLCCLNRGRSDPKVIRRFGRRARQNDKLHAKVIWTRDAAIVGSANASSNGLPEDEQRLSGLIEAGLCVEDKAILASIERWFDREFNLGRKITPKDLEDAALARQRRIWGQGGKGKRIRQSLIEALAQGGKLEFSGQRITFVIWKQQTTKLEDKKAKELAKRKSKVLKSDFNLSSPDIRDLSWYVNWKNEIPLDSFLIDCWMRGDKISEINLYKSFPNRKSWKIRAGKSPETITFVLPSSSRAFGYVLGRKDKAIIRNASRKLWKRAKGSAIGRTIELIDAAPDLLEKR
jgi:hypothetical protein